MRDHGAGHMPAAAITQSPNENHPITECNRQLTQSPNAITHSPNHPLTQFLPHHLQRQPAFSALGGAPDVADRALRLRNSLAHVAIDTQVGGQ